MTDNPDENITLETPHDWVRQGEERAEQQWAASHPARPIELARMEREARRWPIAALLALVVALVLVFIPIGSTLREQAHDRSARRATISNPAPTPTTALTTPTAKVTLKFCNNAIVKGTLSNTSSTTQIFRILVVVDSGRVGGMVRVPALTVSPGETVAWGYPVTFALKKGAVSCSLFSATSEPTA